MLGMGTNELGDETSGSIHYREILDYLRNFVLSRRVPISVAEYVSYVLICQ